MCSSLGRRSWGPERCGVIYRDLGEWWWGQWAGRSQCTQAGERWEDTEIVLKTQGSRGSPWAEGDGREWDGREQIDWKTHLLSVWHCRSNKSSLAWRTIWNPTGQFSEWRTSRRIRRRAGENKAAAEVQLQMFLIFTGNQTDAALCLWFHTCRLGEILC